MTCKRTQGFLAKHRVTPAETVNATRQTIRGRAALAVARGIDSLVVTRGRKLIEVDLKRDRPSDDELLKLLLGPSGNLRAPTLRSGRRLVVGFDEQAYADLLG